MGIVSSKKIKACRVEIASCLPTLIVLHKLIQKQTQPNFRTALYFPFIQNRSPRFYRKEFSSVDEEFRADVFKEAKHLGYFRLEMEQKLVNVPFQ